MAKIGRFTRSFDGIFRGGITTLSVQHNDVRIVPIAPGTDAQAPTHLVRAGNAEVGNGWTKFADSKDVHISLKIDDPSFTGPIYPTLFPEDDGMWTLIWSRGGK